VESIVEISELRKIYRMGDEKIVALDNINLTIYKGEVICILGTSGSGKSTLLNMIAGLEKPTKGQIAINKTRIERMSEKNLAVFRQTNIGFIFQSYNLIPTLTALENVSLPLIFRGMPRTIREKKAAEMLKSVGLGDRLRHKPANMSGGQQQRVSIARAFVSTPPLILADEPTGNLDTKTTLDVMKTIIELVKRNTLTLVVVTHDPEVARLGNRVVHIRDGNIVNIETN
jgi:putative ABC transport system ATP-binding protein